MSVSRREDLPGTRYLTEPARRPAPTAMQAALVSRGRYPRNRADNNIRSRRKSAAQGLLLFVQASEHHVDGAESQPQHSTGEINPTEHWAEVSASSRQAPRPSVSSTSATGQGSSNPAQESEAASAPPATEQDSSRPTDDQIIAQENEIR